MRLVIDLQAYQSPESRIRGIGRYALALARAMVQRAGGHECIVALNGAIEDSVEPLRHAFADVLPAERIRSWASTASIAEAFHGGAPRSMVAGELFRQAMRELRPDFLHVGSLFEGLGSDVANSVGTRSEGLPTAVTLYDLIPLAQSDIYLASPPVRDWYMRKIQEIRRAEVLLAISAATKAEGVELLGVAPERIVNIRGACDASFRPLALSDEQRLMLRRRYGIDRPYVMYAGGFDPRKNILNLIRAYAALPSAVVDAHQLLIVGSPPPNEREQIEKLCSELGLKENQCVLGGYVSDEDLVALYNDCRLYAFPSLQEGFGLPALEAMACGAVVVGSDLSSLPEVIGFSDAMFDPYDVGKITAALLRGLSDEGFRCRFLEHARVQIRQFSWEESARLAWEGLEAAHERQRASVQPCPQVPVSYIGTTSMTCQQAGHLTGFVDKSDVEADRLIADDTPSYLVIGDAASALTAWRVMRRRTVGVIVSGDGVISQAVRELYGQAEGKAMLEFILADQGAYAVALRAGEALFADMEQVVQAWMARVAAEVVQGVGPAIKPDSMAVHRCGRERRVGEAIARMLALPTIPGVDDPYWKDVAEAANYNRQVDNACTSRVLVDISQLVVHDARSGVQRVVRNLLRYLLRMPPDGMQALPIYFDKTDGNCRYARCFCWDSLGVQTAAEDEIVDWLPGDQFLGLDLAPDIIWFHKEKFVRLRDLGVQMNFVVYDMLPEMRPDCFSPDVVEVIRKWYRTVGVLADGVICISRAVADDFVNWLDQVKIERARPIKVGYFHLGADPEVGHIGELDGAEKAIVETVTRRPTVLMVSTIEPRKGYQQALEAFDLLWQEGVEVNLVIVGKAGWRTEVLIERMRMHPEAGQRLHWFEGASDALLHALYEGCDLLLSASEGEGFGLPVIEAAHYGIPLLLRDLRVFREVAGEHAGYFNGYEPGDLAKALRAWYDGRKYPQAWPDSRAIEWLTWQQSYQQFLEVLEGKHWDYQIGATPRYWFPAGDPRMCTQCGVYKRGRLYAGDSPGMLIYGPYAKVVDGTYRLRAYGAVDRHDPDSWLDVVSDNGSRTLFKGAFAFAAEDGEVLLDSTMTLPRTVKDLEIRVWSSGCSQLRLDGFELVRQTST